MVIETDARRFIVEAIDIEKRLTQFEEKEIKKGAIFFQNSKEYNDMRKTFIDKICEINTVANVSGKGRDDLKIDILIQCEEIQKRVS